jgi:hypothetical protein
LSTSETFITTFKLLTKLDQTLFDKTGNQLGNPLLTTSLSFRLDQLLAKMLLAKMLFAKMLLAETIYTTTRTKRLLAEMIRAATRTERLLAKRLPAKMLHGKMIRATTCVTILRLGETLVVRKTQASKLGLVHTKKRHKRW